MLTSYRSPVYKYPMTSIRFLLVAFSLSALGAFADEINHLTAAEKKAGWHLLFDGKDINQRWRNLGRDNVTGKGWVVRAGVLIKKQGVPAGNLITRRTWTDFEFAWEWKLGTKGNNGVKYMVLEKRGSIGHEYQMIDDDFYKQPLGMTGTFYAVVANAVSTSLAGNSKRNCFLQGPKSISSTLRFTIM
jgi:hypothetical protein